MVTPQTNEYQNFLILILMVFLLKLLFDFKSMGGFNYPLLVKLTSPRRNEKSRKANKA